MIFVNIKIWEIFYKGFYIDIVVYFIGFELGGFLIVINICK